MDKYIKVTQVRSIIGRLQRHKNILNTLGLGKMHRTVFVKDCASTRGAVRRVSHLVDWEVVDSTVREDYLRQKGEKSQSFTVVSGE